MPAELQPLAAALELFTCRPLDDGWSSPQLPNAPVWPLVPGAAPFDGVYRGSWISPGLCLRLDLVPPVVAAPLRASLIERFAMHVGTDGAFYEYGIASCCQRSNRDAAILALALKVAAATA